ncbi:5610_t:CDS:2, partial [Cetraspora pellucida]
IASVGNEMFLTIDHVISEYLTPYILSAEHIKMMQCLYFDAMLTNLGITNLCDEVLLVSKVAGFHIKMIASPAQLAVECDDDEMAQWLKIFISQKKHFLANNTQDNMIINEFDNGDIDKNSTIINPLVTKRKGRPETK